MKRKNETFTKLVVGFFMVTLMALLAYFTIVVSGVDLLTGRSRVHVNVVFDQVGGLKDHDNVMYRGTKVGTVEHVAVSPSNLVVTALVDGNVVLRTGCSASVCNLSMLGGNYLLLEEGEGDVVALSDVLVPGETPTDWMRDVARIAKNLNELTSSPEIRSMITNFQAVSVKAKTIAADARELPFPPQSFDFILADVPCSNTGVIRRRPDVPWRFSKTRLSELAVLQHAILKSAVNLLRPGGTLLYSTCSLEFEENLGRVQLLLSEYPNLTLVREQTRLPSDTHDGAFSAVLKLA